MTVKYTYNLSAIFKCFKTSKRYKNVIPERKHFKKFNVQQYKYLD